MITLLFYCILLYISNSDIDDGVKEGFKVALMFELFMSVIMLITILG